MEAEIYSIEAFTDIPDRCDVTKSYSFEEYSQDVIQSDGVGSCSELFNVQTSNSGSGTAVQRKSGANDQKCHVITTDGHVIASVVGKSRVLISL